MNSSPFTSGGDLLRARGRDQALPSWGQKEIDPSGSWLEGKQVDARLRDRQVLLEEPKFSRRDAMACGEWLEESKMVQIVHEAGDFWQHMGAETDIGKCLYPEEAIYLMETGELEVKHGDLPLSIQQAQTTMLQDSHHMDKYLVYAHLTRSGCKVVRHQPHLWFTRYEKAIRLDQHQATKKTAKLQLASKVNTPNSQEDNKNVTKKVEKLDDALAEFYASLDTPSLDKPSLDTVKNSSTSNQITAKETGKSVSCIEKNSSRKKRGRTCSSELSEYELKWKEYLSFFPSVAGESYINIKVEPSELLPVNSVPTKDYYEITQEALNYYSKYVENINQTNTDQYHGHWKDKWKHNGRGKNKWKGNNSFGYQNRGFPNRQRNNDDLYGERSWSDSIWNQNNNRSYGRYHQQDEGMQECTSKNNFNYSSRQGVDMTIKPPWKTAKRKKQKDQRNYFPSCLLKLHVKVNSWKEYKNIVKEMSAKDILLKGPGRSLWRGRTHPLVQPGIASTTQSVLSACKLGSDTSDVRSREWKISPEHQLLLHYDVYLPTAPYRKSQPSQPNKRVTVLREGEDPSPGQILDLTMRFNDDVPVVCAAVLSGEVRLYTLTPVNIPQPSLSG